jgi:glycine oxidase
VTDQAHDPGANVGPGAMTGGFDAVFVGGGVIGLSCAWRAARAGLGTAVIDDAPGRGASWASAGMLAPVTEVHFGEEALLALNLRSAAAYPSFVAELEEASGRSTGHRTEGTLVVARDADDNAALEELFAFQRELGLEVVRLSGRECRSLEGSLAPRARGGILVEGDHQVDSRALVEALLEACRRAGVSFVARRASSVRVRGDRAVGVEVDDGRLVEGARVVLCAGCWSGGLGGVAPETLPPVRPVKGQLLLLRGPVDPALIERTVRGLEVYLVPRSDGRLLCGATVEERGEDSTPTVGATLELLRAAYELVPGITEAELLEIVVGLRPGSPDNAPLIGPSSIEGLAIAAGHFRNGILLAPVTADAIAQLLTTGALPEGLESFDPARFTTASSGAPR